MIKKFKDMLGACGELLSEHGGTSSMRFVMIYVCVVVITTWAYLSIRAGSMLQFNILDISMIGTVIAGKEVQKAFETKKAK